MAARICSLVVNFAHDTCDYLLAPSELTVHYCALFLFALMVCYHVRLLVVIEVVVVLVVGVDSGG